MSQSTPSADLTTDNRPPAPEAPVTPAAQTVQAAPGAVKRSMPMALSILLGIVLAGLAAWLFQTLAWFILLVYLSFVAATVLEGPVAWLTRLHIRRGLAAVLIMLGGLIIVASVLTLLANGIYNQGAALSSQLQRAPDRINEFVNDIGHRFPGLGDRLKSFNLSDHMVLPSFDTLWQNTVAGFAFVSCLVVTFFMVLYMLIDGPDHLKAGRSLLPKSARLEATQLFRNMAQAHRGWALASLINVASATTLTSTGLYLLGVPGALILGFIAGLGELIPNVGPFFGALPALLFTLLIDPHLFLYVAGMFAVVQTIQGYTISPMVLKISVELPVLVIIMSVLVMGTLFGVLGILVAIPLVTDLVVFWNYLAQRREKDTTDYDCVNPPANGTREPAAVDHAPSSTLQKLFRRQRRHPRPGETSPNASAPLDRLERAERRSTPSGDPS